MVRRTRKHDGHAFFGCSAYPKCSGTRDLDGSTREGRAFSGWSDGDLRDFYGVFHD